MGLLLDFNITQEEDGSSYTITDLTGLYDAVNNPGGWGSPNTVLADLVEATIDLQIMDEDAVFTSVLDAVQKNVLDLPNFPNEIEESIEKSVILKDGYYKAIYYVKDNLDNEYSKEKYFTFYSSFMCCYKKIALAVGDINCCTSQPRKIKLLEAHTILTAIEIAASKQTPTTGGGLEVFNTIEYATKYCDSLKCGC